MWKKRIITCTRWFFGIILGLFLTITFLLWWFKDDICKMVIDEVNQYLATEVQVSGVDIAFWGSFPNLSVDFNEVFVKDALPGATNRDTLLYSERIRFKFNPMDIWRENYTAKSIEISPGTLQFKVNENGESNYNILTEKNDRTDTTNVALNLETIELEHFRVSYTNEVTDQAYQTAISSMTLSGALSESVFTSQASSQLKIIEARSGEVTLLRNQPAQLNLSVSVNQDSNSVVFPKSVIHIGELPFHFEGSVIDSLYDFKVSASGIGIDDFANHFALQQVESVRAFKGQGNLLFNLSVHGVANTNNAAKIRCDFGVNKGYLADPGSGIAIRELVVDGYYTNEEGEEKEILMLNQLSFKTRGGPFKGDLKITEFDAPLIDGHTDGLLDLGIVHSLFKIPHVETLEGTVDLHSDFCVRQTPQPNESNTYDLIRCTGSVELHSVKTQFIADKRLFKDINGQVFLRGNEVGINAFTVRVGKTTLQLDGVFKDMVSYLRNQGRLNVSAEIKSDYISLNDLGSSTKEDKVEQARSYILPDNISGSVFLDVGRMDYEDHAFYSIQGNMEILKRGVHFPKISVQNGGADARGSLTIEERKPEYFYISSQLVSKNIRFKPLFKEWDNFEQNVIKSSNIQGTAQANILFEAPFDMRGGIVMNQIKSTIGLQIDDGRLMNVPTFQAITESLQETRTKHIIGKGNIAVLEDKLRNLSFEQMTNTIVIKNGVVVIPKMHIANSALDIDVSGTHSFTNTIDYRFEFRFRDLKQEEQSEFGIIADDGTGFHVFMRMHGDLYDPFIEWDRESQKEAAQERREQEKAELKSLLKSEFGFFRGDTTVHQHPGNQRRENEIIIVTDPLDDFNEVHEEKKPKRNGQLFRTLRKWEEEKKKSEKEDIDFDL